MKHILLWVLVCCSVWFSNGALADTTLPPAELTRLDLVIDQALRAYNANDHAALRKLATPGPYDIVKGGGWQQNMLATCGPCTAHELLQSRVNYITLMPALPGSGVAHLGYTLTFSHGTGFLTANFVQRTGTWYIDNIVMTGNKAP